MLEASTLWSQVQCSKSPMKISSNKQQAQASHICLLGGIKHAKRRMIKPISFRDCCREEVVPIMGQSHLKYNLFVKGICCPTMKWNIALYNNCSLTAWRSSILVMTPIAISLLSAWVSGQGYSVARNLKYKADICMWVARNLKYKEDICILGIIFSPAMKTHKFN